MAPTFDEFWSTCWNVSQPYFFQSWIVLLAIGDDALLAVVAVPGASHPLLERGGGQDGLERRSGLERIRHGPVAPLLGGGEMVRVGIEGGPHRHREDLARPRIHGEDHAALGARGPPRGVQLALGQVLHGGIEGQDEPGARRGRLENGRLSRHLAPERVALHQRQPGLPGQGLVVRQLDPLEPPVVPAHEPEHVRRQVAAGVEPERLRHRADPRQPEGADGLGGGRRDLHLHPHERAIARQALLNVAGPLAEMRGQGGGHRRPVGDLGRKGVHGLDRRAHGQRVAVPVEDGAPLGPERDGLRVLALGEARELVVADDLQVAQPDDDGPEEEEQTASQDERTAPVSGRGLRHGLRTRAGAAAGKTRCGRETRPSGRVPAVTTASPWPVESRSFPGDRPRERAVRYAS